MASGQHTPEFTNRLAREASPYLLQHAHNPVEWWAWGDEAFQEARRRDVPIFLSIGYSTCYWCHVMERESFEDVGVARQMNEGFVCIKVDREERPDVDDVYMAATVITTGHGGWPMSVFLEPKTLRPIVCGTYFPAKPMAAAGGRATFPQVMELVSNAWREKRTAVEEQARQIGEAVREQLGASAGAVELSQGHVANAVSQLLRMYDRVHGGFGSAPKFPQVVFLEFLLDVRERVEEDSTRAAIDEAVRKTLDAMMIGGIRDHVGGGFHRYAVDATWTVPHFEKMLYDNAQMASVYARAARVYGDAEYARVARETLEYVRREMLLAGGGFASAQDAEVDGREGLNYLWTAEEVRRVLADAGDASFAIAAYGLEDGPNFRDPHHADAPAVNVLRMGARLEVVAERIGVAPSEAVARTERINRELLAARARRKQARRDDKVISSWNGLMAAAMVEGYELVGDARFAEMARGAVDAVMRGAEATANPTPNPNPPGRGVRLLRSMCNGVPGPNAVLEDYAFLIHGLLGVYRLEPGVAKYLNAAVELLGVATREFGDGAGGFFDTAAGRTDLFVRGRSSHDGAIPSGASVMLHNLIDLGEITGDVSYVDRAVALLASISPAIAQSPVGAINATRGLLRLLVRGEERAGTLSRNVAADGAVATAGAGSGEPEFLPVEIYASVDRVTVGKEMPAELKVLVRIAEGHHVIAADPGEGETAARLTPFRVGVIGGTGIAAFADYPEGEEYGVAEVGKVRVYRGEFELSIVLEAEGEWKGTPLVSVEYQACTETECLRARMVELDVAVDRG